MSWVKAPARRNDETAFLLLSMRQYIFWQASIEEEARRMNSLIEGVAMADLVSPVVWKAHNGHNDLQSRLIQM